MPAPGRPTASGEITQAGNCLGNVNNLNTEGNPIEVTACSGGSGQAVSLLSNSNIGLEGGCLDVVAAGISPGSDVDWYPCNGTVAQDWTVETNGEIENPNSALCLTNPANGYPTRTGGLHRGLGPGLVGAVQRERHHDHHDDLTDHYNHLPDNDNHVADHHHDLSFGGQLRRFDQRRDRPP